VLWRNFSVTNSAHASATNFSELNSELFDFFNNSGRSLTEPLPRVQRGKREPVTVRKGKRKRSKEDQEREQRRRRRGPETGGEEERGGDGKKGRDSKKF
jgi:hypothetical protein